MSVQGNVAMSITPFRILTGHFKTKTEAVARGKELAKKPALGQLIVNKQDGKIQTEYTYGNDPKRSKG